MKKQSLAVVTILAAMALAATSFAYGPGGGAGNWGRNPGERVCAIDGTSFGSRLNLTAEQEAKVRDLREAHLKEVKPLRDEMYAKRGDLRLLWREKNPDQTKIAALQKDIRTLRDQMQDKATAHRLAMLKVLTPEQQSKVQAYRGAGLGRGAGMHAGRNAGGCPGCDGGAGFGPRGNR